MHAVGAASSLSYPAEVIPTSGEVMAMIKKAIAEMDSATVWTNYHDRENYVKPDEDELLKATKFEKLNHVIFPVKTKDGRYWYLCSIDGNFHLDQRDKTGFRSCEVANHYGRSSYQFPISFEDVNEIENLIKSKLKTA